MTVEELINAFRRDLREKNISDLVQRYITSGECFALDAGKYFELKSRVSRKFNIHVSEVVVVGSAKLGFSIVADKRYRHFGNQSDIDVALCCSEVFDRIWVRVFDYWKGGGHWDDLDGFRRYLFRGWMRPDKLPPANSFPESKEWWEFFRLLSAGGDFGNLKITGALYKNWHFLESYQEKCIVECQRLEVPYDENDSH